MFARPPEHDSWIVARATTATGDTIDILRDGAAAQSNGSPTTAHELPSQHWRYYFRRLTFPEYQHFAPRTAEYLLHRWNRRHDDKPIIGVKLVIYVERFGEVGFESQTLAQAGDSSLPMQLGDDTFDLDRALRALDAASGPNNTGR